MGSKGERRLFTRLQREGLRPRRVPRAIGVAEGADYADLVVGPFMVEEKETGGSRFPLELWWEKVKAEAARWGKKPAIHITQPILGEVVLIRAEDFIELLVIREDWKAST